MHAASIRASATAASLVSLPACWSSQRDMPRTTTFLPFGSCTVSVLSVTSSARRSSMLANSSDMGWRSLVGLLDGVGDVVRPLQVHREGDHVGHRRRLAVLLDQHGHGV